MSERLQNIINGIDSGNIKSVYNFNLTMEELFTRDSNGIYPIEKYLNNERLVEKVIPLVNNIDALLEICTKYNNYSFMKYTNENLLIEDLKLRLKGLHGLRVWMSI